MKTRYVYLGRFAPFHNGHGRLLSMMVEKYGVENVLVLVGSTNTLNSRTPFTYEDREEIIRISFPDVEVLPLPDGKPNMVYFDGTTNKIWLDSIEEIAKDRNEKFVFCGGSEVDLEILAERFETMILLDREVYKVSATEVREKINKRELKTLAKMVDPKALDLILTRIKHI